MIERGPFTVGPSRLYPGANYVSARHEDTKTPDDEISFGYIITLEPHAKTLAYCLNRQFEDEQLIKNLKDNLGRLLGHSFR